MKERVIKHKKAIAIVLAVCLYFALLSMISFVRAPRERQATGESIVNYEDFLVEAEDGRAWLDGAGLHFSDAENTVKKFSAMISLEEFQQIQVEFVAECPQEYAGAAVLHVDLCADGYDADAQEFVVELKAGRNKISQVIDKGDSAPEKAQFRIFCLDAVQCDISELNVRTVKEISYTGKLICATGIIAILLFLFLMLGVITAKQGGEKRKKGNGQ